MRATPLQQPMDTFRHLEAFTAVVAHGSFVQAADHLGLSKSVVSRLVQELEASLGTRLLHRTTRSLSLTDAGTAYHERCRQILEDLAEANAEASARATQPVGRLRINAPLSFGNLHLAPLWGEFMKLYPEVELDITLTDRVVDLVDEGFDLGVRIGRLQASSLVSRRLASDRLILCASPLYLRRAAPITELDDLTRHSVMAYSWLAMGETWAFEGPQGQTRQITVHPRLRTNSGDTCRSVALAGQGVILQPAFLVGEDVRTGRLIEILPQWQAPRLDIHAVYPSRRHVSGKVRAMVDFLVLAFQQPGWAA